MGATIFRECDKSCADQQLARQYWPQMEARMVRIALRQLRTDANMTPEEFADEAGVNRATVYRIEDLATDYAPRITTVTALVESRGITLSQFFAQIEASSTLQKSAPAGTTVPTLMQQQPQQGPPDGHTPIPRAAARFPLDDIGALVARNTAALDELIEAVKDVAGAVRENREQDAGDRAHKPARASRRGEGA